MNIFKKWKLLIVILFFVASFFFIKGKIQDSYAIYRQSYSETINLTVLDPSTSYSVTFDMNDGNNTIFETRYKQYNEEVGTLNTPTRTNYNFLGWYDGTGDNANRIYSDEVITGQVTYYAHWQKIICKKVTDPDNLHVETCASGGCRVSGVNLPLGDITYGTTYGLNSPIAGDAYDCDVNNDGTYDATTQYGKFTERFYFLRMIDNGNDDTTGALVFYTSIDGNGPVDSQHNSSIGSTTYDAALAWLPTKTTTHALWTNPGLIDFDANNGGKISRLLNFDDLTAVCGPISGEKGTTYFGDCGKWFLFENSRFQSTSLGRAGIWLEPVASQHYRIQTQTVQVGKVETSSINTIRPVIEIPLSAFEGFKNIDKHTITFNMHGGLPQIETRKVYTGDSIGAIDTVTKEHFTFDGWYAEFSNDVYSTPVTSSTIVEDDMTLHAKWIPVPTNTVTFDANGGTINNESTYDLIVDAGNIIDENDIPTPVYANYTFDGWYYDDELTEPFDVEDQEPITDDITLYASWIMGNPVARVNGIGYDTLAEAIDAVPVGTSSATTVKILQNITLSEAVEIPSNKWVELDGGSYTISGTTNLITNNGKLNIISGTLSTGNTTETNTIITNVRNATLNISGGTIANNCYVAGATTEFLAIANSGGTVNITGGSITSYGQSATINNNSGTTNISGGEVIAHSVTKGQAVYVAAGTVNISGNAYLENVSGTGESRGCVDNNGGAVIVLGGTIVSNGYSAVTIRKASTTQIGTDDNIIDISTPVLRGKKYGLEVVGNINPTIKVYDGIFESLNQTVAISTTTVTKPENIPFKTDASVVVDGVTYHAAYLLAPSITINFYEETNGTAIPVTVDNGASFGNLLPTPNPKQGYYFAGWFMDGDPLKPVTSATVVNGPFSVYAKWVQSVSDATFDDTMSMQINTTQKIEFEEDDIEDVTYESSDTSVVTVDADGTVHAVDVGTATITMTGSLSSDTETIDVTVVQIMYTVKFYDDDYNPNDLENSTLIDTVQVVSESSIAANNMPTPTKTNYVLSDWYINGNSSTPFTSSTTVSGDLIVVANWKEKVSYANLTKTSDPFELIVGNNGQITLSEKVQNETIEDFNVSVLDDSVATVTKNGNVITVTGAGVGDTTINITGSLSGDVVPVLVSVDVLKYNVTFKDGSTVIKTVKVVPGGTVGQEMPADLAKTNYIFNGWVYDYQSNLTPFTSATQITGDVDVISSWKEQINIATIPDSPMTIMLGASKQVEVTATGEGNLVEDYTLSSSNTNIAEVNGKTIFASSVGTITLTIEGVTSHQTRTITVNVVNSYSVTFDPDNGDTPTVIQVDVDSSIDASNVSLPANPTKPNLLFDDWYLYDEVNNALTTTRLDTMATVTSDITYKAKWVSTTYVAAIGANNYYTTLSSAINAVSNSSSAEIRILQDIVNPAGRTTIANSKDITINANGHTLSCDNSGSTSGNLLYVNAATLRVKNGTFTCSKDGLATFETTANSNIYIESGTNVTNTGNRGAIYNKGNIYISGGNISSTASIRSTIVNDGTAAHITMSGGTLTQFATSYSDKGAGAIKVEKGTVTITGGTVISHSTNSAAIDHTSTGTLTIGTDDVNNNYDATTPVIQGEQYGVYATGNYSVYDGIIKGKTDAVSDVSKITGTETGTEIAYGTEGSYKTLYYTMPQEVYHIDFNPGDGNVTPSYLEYNLNTLIDGNNFPSPTRTNYNFDGWYTDSNFQTPFAPFTPTTTDTVTYYAKWSSTYRINFNPGTDGSVTPSYLDYNLNETINGSNFPTPTRTNYNFDGWYTDSTTQTPFTTITPTAYGETTLFAKWSYASSLTPVQHNILSNAMQDYFTNVSSWVAADATDPSNDPPREASSSNNYDNGHHLFLDSIDEVFTENGCSACGQDNACGSPQAGTFCDQPSEYDTGITDNLNVYLYENNQKGAQVTYVTSTGGKIYNMIPGKTYYWESATDNTKYGVVTATGSRRTLKTAVRNLRDLGGLTASNSDISGTIDYGRLYRGAQITSAQGVTDLTKLGVTREVDLRGNGDGNQSNKMTNYDTGTSSSYDDIIITNYIVNPVITPYIPIAYSDNYDAVKAAMREVMEKVVFNHDSIFFHCTIGTDRTGTLAYFLEGLLGVSEEDRLRDYEMTYFFGLTNRTRFHDSVSWSGIKPRFYSMYRSYPSNQDIYNYYTYRSHTPDPNDPNDLTDDELLRRFRLELIH